jgi:hypothetical protein
MIRGANHTLFAASTREPQESPSPLVETVGAPSTDHREGTCATSCQGSGQGVRGATPPAPVHTAKELLPRNALTLQGVCVRRDTHGPNGGTCAGWGRRGVVTRLHQLLHGIGRSCAAGADGRGLYLARLAGLCRRRRGRRWARTSAAPWRFRLGRTRRLSWREYARATADALDTLGYGSVAMRLRRCGTTATVSTCGACGDPAASVVIHAGCDVRACVYCARREASERSRLVDGAVVRASEFVSTRAAAHLARLEATIAELATLKQTPPRQRAARLARRAVHGTRSQLAGRWSWKLLTISPRWDPTDRHAYSVPALRARLDDVRGRWRALWSEGLSVEGLAAAYVRVELSSHGHVHLHALYYGPFVTADWLSETAGCFVDVRAIDAEGVREAVKYVLKAPSPLRGAWVGGERATVTHPELAARWVVATRHRRLAEPYGVLREAIAAAEVCDEPEAPKPRACASCGSLDLVGDRLVSTAALAKELATAGRWTWVPTKTAGTPLPARVSIGTPRDKHARNL